MGKLRSLARDVAGAFVELEKSPDGQTPAAPAGTPISLVTDNQVDEKLCAAIAKEIETPATGSLTAFAVQLQALATIIPDEATRFRAALAAVATATPGTDKQTVLKAIDERLKALEQEIRSADLELGGQETREVTTRQQELKRIEGDLAALQEQLRALEKQRGELEQRRGALGEEILAIQNRTASKRQRFVAAAGKVKNDLTAFRTKLVSY